MRHTSTTPKKCSIRAASSQSLKRYLVNAQGIKHNHSKKHHDASNVFACKLEIRVNFNHNWCFSLHLDHFEWPEVVIRSCVNQENISSKESESHARTDPVKCDEVIESMNHCMCCVNLDIRRIDIEEEPRATRNQDKILGTADTIKILFGPYICCRKPPMTDTSMGGISCGYIKYPEKKCYKTLPERFRA